MSSLPPIIAQFERAGQAQVFAFFDRLTTAEQAQLLAEAGEIDLAEVDRLYRTLVAKNAGATSVNLEGLAPAPLENTPHPPPPAPL